MTTAQAVERAIIHASPAAIYAVLSDYRYHHPKVLPQPYFQRLVIEEGGQGAGTVFRAEVHVFGTKNQNHMVVSEPEPGRRLVERDLESGLETAFILTPVAGAQECLVEIKSTWTRKPGPFGWFEAWSTSQVMKMIYRKELAQLDSYMGQVQM